MSFKCSYCGKEYEAPVERARCEIACEAEMKKKAEQDKANQLKAEKNNRFQEIQGYINLINEKMNLYNKDYGEKIYLTSKTNRFPFQAYM